MKTLILIPQFVDRGGRTVYHIKEYFGRGDGHGYVAPMGDDLKEVPAVLGEIRLPENDGSADAYEVEVEWARNGD